MRFALLPLIDCLTTFRGRGGATQRLYINYITVLVCSARHPHVVLNGPNDVRGSASRGGADIDEEADFELRSRLPDTWDLNHDSYID